jgi:hypothetical protein
MKPFNNLNQEIWSPEKKFDLLKFLIELVMLTTGAFFFGGGLALILTAIYISLNN